MLMQIGRLELKLQKLDLPRGRTKDKRDFKAALLHWVSISVAVAHSKCSKKMGY